ncbi:MAG: VWA domain-containing protein [Bacteroidales bacterium]|nr:VWA domain-containing protein [Bacteroidales bacterium]
MKKLIQNLVTSLFALLFVVCAYSQAEKAKYYIEGNYEIVSDNHQLVYKLYDIKSKNISFSAADTLYGITNEDETVYFEFEKAQTTNPNGFKNGLKFWRWQKKSQEWLEDSEIQNAEQSFSTNKVMSIVLILDCSKSIGSDFAALQESAIKFVSTLASKVSKNGNVHLGLIGFSTMKNTQTVVPLQPLNASTAPEIIDAISNMQLGTANGTALYYAMHKGVEMIDSYVETLRINDGEIYDGSSIISFTDGYDNSSIDPSIGLPNDDDDMLRTPYFNYLKRNILTQTPNGKPLDSYLIAVKGKDANYNKADFEGAMQELSSSKEHFYPVENFDLLQGEFQKIADRLVDKWKNLKCYVPRSFVGKVRWTLGNEIETQTITPTPATETKPVYVEMPVEQEKEQEPITYVETPSRPNRIFFWGFHTGFGFEAVAKFHGEWSDNTDLQVIENNGETYYLPQKYNGVATFKYSIGADLGAWVMPNWELGGYVTYHTPILISFGLQTLFGNPEGWGGYIGLGYNGGIFRKCPVAYKYRDYIDMQRINSSALEIRAGVKYKNLYAFLNCAFGKWNSQMIYENNGNVITAHGHGTGCIMTVNVGYNFSSLIKK